jgi:protein-S-isoprenylcysteine O-methyltransferase Ste14
MVARLVLVLFVVLMSMCCAFEVPKRVALHSLTMTSTTSRKEEDAVARELTKIRETYASKFGKGVSRFRKILDEGSVVQEYSATTKAIISGIRRNAKSGEVGKRGGKLLATALGIFCMVTCGVPPVVSWLIRLAGAPMIAYGAYVILSSVWQLREHNSPYIIPSSDNKLVTGGVYKYVTHPMYGGIIASSMGIAIYTNSVEKLVLGALLTYVLVSPQHVHSHSAATSLLTIPLSFLCRISSQQGRKSC